MEVHLRTVSFLLGAISCLGILTESGLAAQSVNIAPMTWTPRSDWINVKTDPAVSPHAMGDGVTDDTSAIQAAMTVALQTGTANGNLTATRPTVYLPPGTYKISSTLAWNTGTTGVAGLSLVGCGSKTTIAWYGPSGGTMFSASLVSNACYTGICWNGRNQAATAILHNAAGGIAEDPIRYWNDAFLNFTGVALDFDNTGASWTGGVEIWNCLFYNCEIGSQIGEHNFNDYEYLFQACEFESCGTGIDSCRNVAEMVYDTHFDHSSVTDMTSLEPVHARRCTSTGSKMFLQMPEWTGAPVQPHVLEDCWVDSWTNTGTGLASGAVVLGDHCQAMIFDCKFTNPPNSSLPINMNCPSWPGPGAANLIVSNNSFPGVTDQASMVQTGLDSGVSNVLAVNVAPASQNVGITTTLTSPGYVFLNSTPITDGPILDVTQPPYNANNKAGADATAAIQQAITAASQANNGSIVYLPAGTYLVGSTLNVTGANYTIEGAGYWTQLCWTGGDGSTVMSVNTPSNISLKNFMIKVPSITAPTTAGITENSSGASTLAIDSFYYDQYGPAGKGGASPPSGFYPYETNPFLNFTLYPTGPGLILNDLPSGSQTNLGLLISPLTIHDCGSAEILANHISGGAAGVRMSVDGATHPKTGFLGILYYNGMAYLWSTSSVANAYDLTISDNQDCVIGDYYNEQTHNNILLENGTASWSGRVTIQAFKQQDFDDATALTIKNYNGWLFYPSQTFQNIVNSGSVVTAGGAPVYAPPKIIQTGTNPFTLILPVATFLGPTVSITQTSSSQVIQALDQGLMISQPNNTTSLTPLANNPNPLTQNDYTFIGAGLDHLRQLNLEDLKLLRGPSAVTLPVSQTVVSGQAVTLSVAASGTGTLTYQWLKNNTPLFGATLPTYTIANTAASDAGSYSVVVSNAFGSWTTTPVSLAINSTSNGSGAIDSPALPPEWALVLAIMLVYLALRRNNGATKSRRVK